MLLGQDNILRIHDKNEYIMCVGHIYKPCDIIVDNHTVRLINFRHCKSHKVVYRIETECGKVALVGKKTYFRVFYELVSRTILAGELQPGMVICMPNTENGVIVKKVQLILARVSHVIFEDCDYVKVGDIPVLHDNDKNANIRRLSRLSLALGFKSCCI